MSELETNAHGYGDLVAVLSANYGVSPEVEDPLPILWAADDLAGRIGEIAAAKQHNALNDRREREGLSPAIAESEFYRLEL